MRVSRRASARERARRDAFTVVELTMALVLIGLLLAISVPGFAMMRNKTDVRAAREQVATYISTARAIAVRHGATAQFNVAGNTMWVSVDSSGTQVTVLGKVPLNSQFRVQVTSSNSSIAFDARGFAQGLASTATVVLDRDGVRDSVCVSRAGAILSHECKA